MTNSIKYKQYIRGINIVELLVALALGSFLSIGIVQMYASHRVTTRNTEGLAEVQDNLRYALRTIGKDVRIAGYLGCMSRNRGEGNNTTADDIKLYNLLNDSSDMLYDFSSPIRGYNDLSGSVPTDLQVAMADQPTPMPDTDLLMIKGVSDDSVGIVDNNQAASFFAELTGEEADGCGKNVNKFSGLCPEDIVIASDCKKAVIFQITNLQATGGNRLNVVHAKTASITPGNSNASWKGGSGEHVLGEDAEIIKMNTNIYYIGDNDGRPGLYRIMNGSDAQLIANNVADMQLTYGTGTDDATIQYNDADNVSDWDNVTSVRLNLLVASETDNIVEIDGQQGMSVPFNGEIYTADDRRLYKSVTTTVVLRNRVQ